MQNFIRFLLIMTLLILPGISLARQSPTYDNPDLGIAFDLPDGWQVRTDSDTLTAGSPESLAQLDNFEIPSGLVIRIMTGNMLDLNMTNASELPTQLSRLVPQGITPPQPVEVIYGNASGWRIDYSNDGMSNRVVLLSLSGGRVALLRAFSTDETWEQSTAQIETLKETFFFTLPVSLANPLADLPDEDGGVLWHYQASRLTDSKPVTLGGLAYDPFDSLIYIAAGQRGILVLDTAGEFVNYLNGFYDDDNFVDIVIGIDAKLYVANATPGDNNQIMIINRLGQRENSFGWQGDDPGGFAPGMPRTIAVTRDSNIWTISEGHASEPTNRLYEFDKWGNLLKMIDLAEVNPTLRNIRMDNNLVNSGLYLVGESGGLNMLDSDGQPLVTNLALEVFSQTIPVDIAIAPGDNIIIATDSEGFLEFAPSGALIDRFGLAYDAARTDPFQPGETLRPMGLMVDRDGIIYFAETHPSTGYSQAQAFRFVGDGLIPLPGRPGSGQGVATEARPDPAAGGGTIEYGAIVQGSLNNQYPSHDWYFEGEAGDRIRITLRDITPDSSNEIGLDTLVMLFDPDLYKIAENDDINNQAPEGFQPTDSVLEFNLQAFGFYTIRTTRFGGRGDYELTLELIDN